METLKKKSIFFYKIYNASCWRFRSRFEIKISTSDGLDIPLWQDHITYSLFLRVKTIPTDQHESFQHILSSFTCLLGIFLGDHSTYNYSRKNTHKVIYTIRNIYIYSYFIDISLNITIKLKYRRLKWRTTKKREKKRGWNLPKEETRSNITATTKAKLRLSLFAIMLYCKIGLMGWG